MIRDAESHAEEDKKQVELAQTRNGLESLAHSAERAIKDAPDLPAADKSAVEEAVAKAREAAAGDDIEAMKTQTESLATAMQPVMARAQAQAQPKADGDGDSRDGADGGDDDNVIDAEYEEVGDKK